MARHIEALVEIILICVSNPEATIADCLRPTRRDLDEIWNWNKEVTPTYNFCMHELVAEQAERFPNKVAIASWDGDLTYDQIDEYSTYTARLLQENGVRPGQVLPICFEKSRWTIVALLAVMKTGATFVLFDPTLPLARLQNMAEQVGASIMLSSRKQRKLAMSIISSGTHIFIDAESFEGILSQPESRKLPIVPPSTLMYIIFTSGSTGTPKGVKISHTTYTSSAVPRAKAVGYTESTRTLDFASYAFDVSIDSMLLTLGNGGCLCIPSDEDRLNDMNGVIRKMRVNYAGLTPSVARVLESEVIESLDNGLGLGGEAVSARDVNIWGQMARIIIGYGPCECTIGCTINSSAATGRNYISIGEGNGANMWIVHPEDHNVLMPVGAVGELLVEGPIVGQGYLNDAEKTETVFIEDLPWLIRGHNDHAGRKGRLYKTGDLGKYDLDGSRGIVFVGRKDTQVKLRGQRVELGEIESQLKARLPSQVNVIAEVLSPLRDGAQPTLVAFISLSSVKGHESLGLQLVELDEGLNRILSAAEADLAGVLPRYMVPSAYIPVSHIPVLVSGKTDRKQLRKFGAAVDLRRLGPRGLDEESVQSNPLEQILRSSWSEVLKIDAEGINSVDNFFALGGDSLSAMKLVSACRANDLHLTVANIFDHPTLSAMAGTLKLEKSHETVNIEPFCMLSQSVENARREASIVCGVDPEAIEDIHPCTPTQESLFTFSIRSTEPYIAQRVARIPSHISAEAWTRAWERVVASIPILRTRLVQIQEPGLQQVILNQPIAWRRSTDLTQYLENDRLEKMELGQPLARYAIIHNANDSNVYMVWTVHHVLYDGWSEPLILKIVSDVIKGQDLHTPTQIKDFVQYVRSINKDDMQGFWRQELEGAVGPQFPALPSRDYQTSSHSILEHSVQLDKVIGGSFTAATLIRGAWALVASRYTGSDDVVFGETLMGRDISLANVESIIGPLITTLPVRIRIDRKVSVENYLRTIQKTMSIRTPFQHMGMQNIRKVSRDAQYACEAGTGLVIQPEPDDIASELGFDAGDVVHEALHFNPYPLMIGCGLRKGGFRVCASFDCRLMQTSQIERILRQLEQACTQLMIGRSRLVGDVCCLPEEELDRIWRWNKSPPLSFNKSSKKFRADEETKKGSNYPRAMIPWVCDQRNPSLLVPIGCIGELWLEGGYLLSESTGALSWLINGSSTCIGRKTQIQATGDLVRLEENGSLTFAGRKETRLAAQSNAFDVSELEAHLIDYLPPTTRAAVALTSALNGQRQESGGDLVVFIEQHHVDDDAVELMSSKQESILRTEGFPAFETRVHATAPSSLVKALKKFDKFIKDSLPAYMIPYIYIVVDKLPLNQAQQDRKALHQLANQISQDLLSQLHDGMTHAWTSVSTEENLTPAEHILRISWAKILGMKPEMIDLDDNFFRLGGDSVLAMKLVSTLRVEGHVLTVADIFHQMRLVDAARVLKVGQVLQRGEARPYKAFSTLPPDLGPERFLAEVVRPKLKDPEWLIRDVLPITDSQALDLRATLQPPRTSIQYTALYFDGGVDLERLSRACNIIVDNHEILQTTFVEHESKFYQVVIDNLGAHIPVHQTDKDLRQYVVDLCNTDIETEFSLGSFFVGLLYVEGTNDESCLIVRLSHAQYDGVSLPNLLRDLEKLYATGQIAAEVSFSSYMARVLDERVQTKAIDYWSRVLQDSSLSTLAGITAQPTDKSIFLTRPVDAPERPQEITTASLLTAAWALVLARWLRSRDVTFGSVTSSRNIDLLGVEDVMGPCYQFTPIRVTFQPQWKAMDLLQFVQRQSAESAAYDFLGFEKISKVCTNWSSLSEAKFFPSIVHHQDWEDFDTMSFGSGTCRVETLSPHGDAASPLKVISYVKGGQMYVGIVGSEREREIVETIFDELVEAVEELANDRNTSLLFDEEII